MRRLCLWFAIFWIAIFFAFALFGCVSGEKPEPYNVDYAGRTFSISREHGTVSCDGVVYRFELSDGGQSVDMRITYPDGSRYYWTQNGVQGSGGWSDDYDPEASGYLPGDLLWEVLTLDIPAERSSGLNPLFVICLLLLGAVLTAFPRAVWTVEYGWRYKNAEPSDAALAVNRVVGILLLIAGIVCLIVSI